MKFLSTLLVLGGYTLVYAAVAHGGVFYSNPWEGLFRDAWGVDSAPDKSSGRGNSATPPGVRYSSGPTVNPRTPRPRTPLPSTA